MEDAPLLEGGFFVFLGGKKAAGGRVFPLMYHYRPPPEKALLALIMPVVFQKKMLPRGFGYKSAPGGF